MSPRTATERARLDVDAIIADRDCEIVICCGAGGVGKTTLSASLAVRAAEAGRKVVVLTIDPARRLAQSLGLGELDNVPRAVAGIDTAAGGSLDAMMLDMKRTFDEVVLASSTKEKAEQILANPFYEALSTSFSGTQEYMAMEKLGQLHAQAVESGQWDMIIVDTPPARSALDFLDAPEHLSTLLDGRFLRLLLAPAKGPFKLMSMGFGLVSSAMNKVLGAQILTDVQTFVTAFEALFGGFRQRAEHTLQLLSSEQTTFIVVATPEPDTLREAAYFVDRLSEEGMPLAGLAVNRVHRSGLDVSAERALAAAEQLTVDQPPRAGQSPDTVDDTPAEQSLEHGSTNHMTVVALQRHAARMRLIEREQMLLNRFGAAHPDVATSEVEALATDVTDLDALRRAGLLLADED